MLAVWGATLVGFALFLAFSTVTISIPFRPDPQVSIAGLWQRFVADVASSGNSTLVRLVLYAIPVVLIVGGAVGLLLALLVTEQPATVRDERSTRA